MEGALVGEQLRAHRLQEAEGAGFLVGQANVSGCAGDWLSGGGWGSGLFGALGDGAQHGAHSVGLGGTGGDKVAGQIVGAVLAGEVGDGSNAAALGGNGIGCSRRPLLGQINGFHGGRGLGLVCGRSRGGAGIKAAPDTYAGICRH